MFLVDTNVFLEVLLQQQRADEAQRFLLNAPVGSIHITDFRLYSIGILLVRRNLGDVFELFVEDMAAMRLVRLNLEELASLGETARNLNLDFDDAYQYVLAQRRGLRLVSFDADFDRTPLGRVTPAQALGN
ncbi:PIN domain-containing protein [Ancylothrix sp. C2]|uniref:type II toxin-antitoxin system VapC family toxin n=1 Tax=Ancylothrix sp. D3o TaxID=2953691 RepID=UPI0021BB4868|nr:PIN domain-containing protein [Ancylothrix sp. D3o]MCT7951612.1 PIN domain-containing protein [Ancylothrix sp. D3o]